LSDKIEIKENFSYNAKTKHVRTCVLCRTRYEQNQLLRLQCKNKKITTFTKVGRSFYLCSECFEHKNISKMVARQCKTAPTAELLSQLKEIITNVRKS